MSDRPTGPRLAVEGGMGSCWFCAKPVSPQALFCHSCGSLQPPGERDAFARLNLKPRFDLEASEVERQAAGFERILDPARLEKRGTMERTLAEKHRAAIAAAREELRDPVARAKLLLRLAGREVPPPEELAAAWLAELDAAADGTAVDRIAARIGEAQAGDLRALSAAFQAGDLDQAAHLVARLDGLGGAMAAARHRRGQVLGSSPGF